MKKYNWTKIQKEYNNGKSQRDIIKKYNMSSATITHAVRRGDLISRSKSEAGKLDHTKGPRIHTEKTKQKLRENILQRYKQGWMPKAGRCKKYIYSSPIAGTVSLDGTWELVAAKWLDYKEYKWTRNTKKFTYINLRGTISNYTPDFFVEGIGFIEVKGYETELDRCKWTQFQEPLIIWYKKEITILNSELAEWLKAPVC